MSVNYPLVLLCEFLLYSNYNFWTSVVFVNVCTATGLPDKVKKSVAQLAKWKLQIRYSIGKELKQKKTRKERKCEWKMKKERICMNTTNLACYLYQSNLFWKLKLIFKMPLHGYCKSDLPNFWLKNSIWTFYYKRCTWYDTFELTTEKGLIRFFISRTVLFILRLLSGHFILPRYTWYDTSEFKKRLDQIQIKVAIITLNANYIKMTRLYTDQAWIATEI